MTAAVSLGVFVAGSGGAVAAEGKTRAGGVFPKEALLFWRGDAGDQAETAYAVNADGSGLKSVPIGLRSPDGRWRAFLRCLANCVNAESGDGQVGLFVGGVGGGRVRRVATSRRLRIGEWSPDGRRLAYSGFSDDFVYFVGIYDRLKMRTIKRISGFEAPRWSPDGRHLLVERASGSELYTVSAKGNSLRFVARAWHGSWSADGKRIVYEADETIYSVSAGGTAVRTVIRAADFPGAGEYPQLESRPQWSPRGDWIAVTAAPRGDWGVYLVRPDGREVRRVLELGGYAAATQELLWSPTGRFLAANVFEQTYSFSIVISDVFVIDVTTGATSRLTQGWKYGYENGPLQWHPRRAATGQMPGAPRLWTLSSDTAVGAGEIRTSRVVDRLAADGARAAYTFVPPTFTGYYGRDRYRHSWLNCGESWDPRAQTTLRLRVPCSGTPWGPQGIAVAGDRFAWIENTLGSIAGSNHTGVYWGTTALPAPNPVWGSDRPAGDLIGDGDLIVFDTWTRNPTWCLGSQCYGPPKSGGQLYRVDANKGVVLVSSEAGVTPLSVDAGRVLVDRGAGVLELLHADGEVVHTFQFSAAAMRGARLQGRDLVVLTPTSVELTDAETGAFVRRWPAPPDAELADLQDGVALLIAGTKLHLLRLADGHDSVIDVRGSPPIRAQLEADSLFYSYRADDPAYPGRVVFTPFDT